MMEHQNDWACSGYSIRHHRCQKRPFSDRLIQGGGSGHRARGSGDLLLVNWIQGSFLTSGRVYV